MSKGIGLCVATGVLLAAAVLWLWGVSVWTVLLALVALGCPVAALGVWYTQRELRVLDEPIPHTHGLTMSWAAPIYDAYCPWFGIGPRFRADTLRHAGIVAGEHVLDVGCGTGVLTRRAAEVVGSAGTVTGIDPSPGMIAMARANKIKAASRAEFRLAAIEALPFPDAAFDLVLSSFMLHHLPPDVKRAGLREVHRVLKPGGRLLAVDIDRPANPLWWLLFWPLLFFHFTASNLRGEVPGFLRDAGFDPVERMDRRYWLLTFWRSRKPEARSP